MKQKILLTLMAFAFFAYGYAQKNAKKSTAYAITAKEKGSSSWTEVRLVDLASGEEVKSIYQSSVEVEQLNARTGKPIIKKDLNEKDMVELRTRELLPSKIISNSPREIVVVQTDKNQINSVKPEVKNDVIVITINDKDGSTKVRQINNIAYKTAVYTRCSVNSKVQSDKPFATTSAACAYDKKHDRLYYTPMGINQLRYVDVKGETPTIYYFEDEEFGVVSGRGDVNNQITRMVIASDGNGYALNNQADHLIRFTTNKKAEITDLGALTDDVANNGASVHHRNGYGGDMIADKKGGLYLITGNRQIFKIDVKTMVATYVGGIKGLPRGFSTNAAVVDNDNNIVVASANSTLGYFKFNMEDLQAEKISTSEKVFNASDLANSNLLSVKKKKKNDVEQKPEEVNPLVVEEQAEQRVSKPAPLTEMSEQYKISVYPNPVREGNVKVNFTDYPAGKYEIQLMDVSGKLISSKSVNLRSKGEVQQFALPKLIAKGTYLLKVIGDTEKVLTVEQLVVQ